MSSQNFDVIICGAGSAGVAVAYYLAQKGISNVLIVDKHPPLSQTSAKSGENYRNWWPNQVMVDFMNRSIDLMESLTQASEDVFNMERRGYAYATAKSEAALADYVAHYQQLNVGEVRVHNRENRDMGLEYVSSTVQKVGQVPTGADLLFDQSLIQEAFPHFSSDVRSVIHARRAGSVSAQQLGMYLLGEAKRAGVQALRGEVTAVNTHKQTIQSVEIRTGSETHHIETRTFINAAGPFAPNLAAMLNIQLPIYSILQQKIAIKDPHKVIPRDAPFTIFMDSQTLDWTEQEKEDLATEPKYRWLLDELPGGLHIKPEGGQDSPWIKLGWAINQIAEAPRWELEGSPEFVDVVLRGASKLVPGLSQYIDHLPQPVVHYAGYYTRTQENLPIIGPLEIGGAFMIGALSGFGTMASCAAGELIAAWVSGDELPDYALPLSLARYQDSQIMASLQTDLEGQL